MDQIWVKIYVKKAKTIYKYEHKNFHFITV